MLLSRLIIGKKYCAGRLVFGGKLIENLLTCQLVCCIFELIKIRLLFNIYFSGELKCLILKKSGGKYVLIIVQQKIKQMRAARSAKAALSPF